jgi:hypothetical protein
MKKALVYALLLFPVLTFSQPGDSAFRPKYTAVLDTSKGRLLVRHSPRPAPQKISAYWNIEQKDIDRLHKFFRKITSVPASGAYLSGTRQPLGLDNYAYQYTGIVISKKKYIYVNAFYLSDIILIEDYKDWQTEPVTWKHGEFAYWSALFDVKKGEFSQLVYNSR